MVSANNLTVAARQSVSLSSIFSVTGTQITQYRVWFSWPDGGAPALGTLTNNGTAIPLNQPVTLTSLSNLVYTAGNTGGTDKIWLEAYNGTWSNGGQWTEADVTDQSRIVSDTSPPRLLSIGLGSSSLNMDAGQTSALVTAHFTDDLSGLSGGMASLQIRFVSPSGQGVWGVFDTLHPISGDALDALTKHALRCRRERRQVFGRRS